MPDLKEIDKKARNGDELARAYLMALAFIIEGMKEFSLFSEDELHAYMVRMGNKVGNNEVD